MSDQPTIQSVINTVKNRFSNFNIIERPLLNRHNDADNQLAIEVSSDHLIEVMTFLRNDDSCLFVQCSDVNGLDYLNFPGATDRYCVTYCLISFEYNLRLWVKCFANDPNPSVPSVTCVWKGAEWQEREIYDMFGIEFTDHPDLRRILTWDEFKAFPLRKDYPLTGQGEREDYPVIQRDDA